MKLTPDITATLIFHQEGPYAIPAIESLRGIVCRTREAGITVETQAILDRPDEQTKRLVATRGSWLDSIREVAFGDLGLSRNAGVSSARGRFVAFFDGDDLWGEEWLLSAFRCAAEESAETETIWHPEYLFYFSEGDFDRHSTTLYPHAEARSFHMLHFASDAPEFERKALLLNNVWTANVFASRALHERFPYAAVDRERGFGIEDWSWHLLTVWEDISHRVVPGTVHMIRQKDANSLGLRNTSEGLLPSLPPAVRHLSRS